MKCLLLILSVFFLCDVPSFGQMGILTNDDKLYALEKEGKFDEAIADINNRIKLQPNNGELYLRRADFLRLQNKLDEAIADISKAIEIEPDNAAFYIARAEFFNLAKNNKAVLKDVQTALSLSPDKLNSGAKQLFIGEQYEENIRIADSYIARDYLENWLRHTAYKIRSKNKFALKDYVGALEDAIESIKLIHFTGKNFEDMRATNEAADVTQNVILPVTQKHLKNDKKIFEYYNRIFAVLEGKILISFEQGRNTELKRWVKPDESDENKRLKEENLMSLGIENYRRLLIDCSELYAEKGQPEKGVELFERILKLKPDWLGHLHRARLYKKLERYQEAIADFTVTLSVGLKRPGMYVERGDLYVLTNQFDKAIADYEMEKMIFTTAEAKMNEKIATAKQKLLENANQPR